MEPLAVLADDAGLPRSWLPAELERLYGGGLGFDEPVTIANFVQSLDGVVSLPELPRSNALIADGSESDRFVMGLLRACADVVLVGSGTLLASPQGTWQADRVWPRAAEAFARLRSARGRPARAAVAILTAGGSLDPAHPVLAEGALVLTTEGAAPRLRAAVPSASEVVAIGAGAQVDLGEALALLRERRHSVVLSEAGPTVFGSLLAAALVDELFLTVSPLVAGRAEAPRLSLAEGLELLPGTRVAGALRSVRRDGSHLFLRYALA
jgi:riboflavin biosynthesis pyrimidine reductase